MNKRVTYCGRRRIASGTLIKQFWDNFKLVILDDKSGTFSRAEKEVNPMIFKNGLSYFSDWSLHRLKGQSIFFMQRYDLPKAKFKSLFFKNLLKTKLPKLINILSFNKL